MTKFLELAFSGVAIGAVYALISLGFVIVFKATGVVNFAHGALLVVGAYFTWVFRVREHLAFPLAFGLGVLIAAAVALAAERLFIRPLAHQPVISVAILTIGIDILLRTEVNRRIGVDVLSLGDPWGARVVHVGGVTLPETRIAAIVVSGLLLAAFFAWFKFSTWGTAMRAAAEDSVTAALLGVRLGRVSAVAWAIAGALAAVAGLFLVAFPSPGLDQNVAGVALLSFPAAVLGGLDSTGGAVVGGLVIGVASQFTQGYQSQLLFLGRGFHDVMPYVIMLVVLLWRPAGLFGTRDVSRV